ncbi:MAG: OmpA family protein [Chlorobi bacterium]|nr:OmpA family protein [Chlorobiota bacterium]
MKRYLTLWAVLWLAGMWAQTDGLPPNPEPGKCYVKCVTENEFREEPVQVKVRDQYKVLKVIPAKFKWVEERVVIKEPSKKFIVHPAVYKWVEVPYVKKEATKKLKVIPAQFGSGTETVEIFPKTAEWEYTTYADCPSSDPEDCRVLCYVEKPAQYVTVPTKPLIRDASVEEIPVPEQKATYKKQVLVKDAWCEEVPVPAEYGTIRRLVVESPPRVEEQIVPPEYKTVIRKVLVKKGGVTTWKEIDCGLVKPTRLNIYWPYNSATLTPEAKREIDTKLLTFLREHPDVVVEIASHTDSRGSKAYNKALSQRRADAVKNYLISKGISPDRIISRGYGEERLLNNCRDGVPCTEAQHQQNRRTEFRVVEVRE